MIKQKIYIAGPITGREQEAKKAFQDAEDFLTIKGFEVVNPMKLPHQHDKRWESYMRECIKALCDCDAVYMLHNHKYSTGAMEEKRIASAIGLHISYQEIKII